MLIFGCGYVGLRVARRLISSGETSSALTRSRKGAERLQAAGVVPLIGDITAPSTLTELPEATNVLFAVGYDRQGGHDIHQVYVEGLRNVLDALPRPVERFVYLSSTGVYGPHDGQWVDEQSPCQPQRAGGRACLAAEQLLAEHPASRGRQVILRLAGIYGPGRVPRIDDIRAGRAIEAPADGWLNLIHVDDIVTVIQHCLPLPTPQLLNVSDGHPVARRDYYRQLAQLLQAPEPRFGAAAPDSPAAQRAAADKRISNRRLLSVLRLPLQFPECRAGLKAILESQSSGDTQSSGDK